MPIFGDLVDRTFRTYLEPPNKQPASLRLQSGIDADDLTMTVGGWAVPEDETLMRNEVLVEFGSELIRSVSYDELTGICTIERGAENTTPAVHASGLRGKLAPPFPRQSVYEALADNLLGLSPSIYTVRNAMLTVMAPGVAPLEDPLSVAILEVSDTAFGDPLPSTAYIVDFHHITGGRSMVIPGGWTGAVWVRYRRRFDTPTSEADTFEDLGLEDRWANIVMLGAVADLFVGTDVPEAQTEWVGQVLKTEGIRVGSRLSIAAGLRQYQQILLDIARKEMGAEYRPRIRSRRATVDVW